MPIYSVSAVFGFQITLGLESSVFTRLFVPEELIEKRIDVHFRAVPGKQYAVLQRGIAVPDEGDLLPRVKRAVADGAVRNAAARQLLLIRKTQVFVLHPRRDDHAFRLVLAVIGLHRKSLAFFLHGKHLFQLELGAERP